MARVLVGAICFSPAARCCPSTQGDRLLNPDLSTGITSALAASAALLAPRRQGRSQTTHAICLGQVNDFPNQGQDLQAYRTASRLVLLHDFLLSDRVFDVRLHIRHLLLAIPTVLIVVSMNVERWSRGY